MEILFEFFSGFAFGRGTVVCTRVPQPHNGNAINRAKGLPKRNKVVLLGTYHLNS